MSHTKTHIAAKSPYQIQVLDRALAILEILSTQGPDLSLGEISDKLELHKSTAHRLIMVLERHKFIERNSVSGRYRLGLKLFELGTKGRMLGPTQNFIAGHRKFHVRQRQPRTGTVDS